MKLLHIANYDDGKYLDKFSKLPILHGVQVAVSRSPTIRTSADVQLLAQSVKADAVICTDPDTLKLVLESQYDYIPPNTKRGVTLDDYAGSLLTLHQIPNFAPEKEFLVLNPPEQLYTVSSANFVFQRFLSKLITPQKWYPQTKFEWRLYDPLVESLDQLYSLFSSADLLAIDIETKIGDPDRRINCVGYAAYFRRTNTTVCAVIPFTSWEGVCEVRRFNLLPVPKIFQNGLYDNTYFARFNCLPTNWIFDTQHLFHSWLAELPKRLDFIAAFNVRRIRYWKDDGSTGSLSDYYRYNAMDCWATLNTFLGIMQDAPDWAIRNYVDHEFPIVFPCFHCGLEGSKQDIPRLAVAKAETQGKHLSQLNRLRKIVGDSNFNPGSWQQVLKLFRILGLNLQATGKAEMLKAKASSVFNEIILNLVTDCREHAKLISNYYDESKIWCGRIFYTLNPAKTDSGRLNSSESAFWCGYQIQNVTRGESVKQCHVADDGWLLCEIDKKQSEARCVAYLSGETKLIELVESNKDYHGWNAQEFFGVAYEKIIDVLTGKVLDKILRDLSKRTNHGANYNMGADVMLDTMGPKNVLRAKKALRLPIRMRLRDVCAFLLERYSATYPKVKGLYYTSIVKRIVLSGQLVSPLGWVRKFFGSPAKNKRDLNAAVAHEPQNLSVGIVNREFFNIWFSSIYGELKGLYRLKAQIHDSIFGQYKATRPDVPALIEEKYMRTTVPIKGADDVVRNMFIPNDISCGKNRWSELK